MKYEWRKKEKEYYIPKEKPQLVEIPEFKYFTLKGKGNPNSEAFKECIQVLYSLSYAIRMMPKNGITPEGYFEYTVYPLEGIWDLSEKCRLEQTLNKDELIYKLILRKKLVQQKKVNKMVQVMMQHKKVNKVVEVRMQQLLNLQKLRQPYNLH